MHSGRRGNTNVKADTTLVLGQALMRRLGTNGSSQGTSCMQSAQWWFCSFIWHPTAGIAPIEHSCVVMQSPDTIQNTSYGETKGGSEISMRVVQDLSFAVFGLGNKQYEHYAEAGKQLYKGLSALGASPLCRRGDGDDDDDIDADFESWTSQFLTALDDSSLGLISKVLSAVTVKCTCSGIFIRGLILPSPVRAAQHLHETA